MFITASHKKLDLSGFDRLYAFPTIPALDDNSKIILDSGAFALSKSGGEMDNAYMHRLAKHYEKYGSNKNVFCIAPDVFKNAYKSIRQFKIFTYKYPALKVAPVLQFKNTNIDLFDAKKQIDAYSLLSTSKMICISNNKFNPIKQADELRFIVSKIRRKSPFVWIHVLGAGYSHNNVKDWLTLGVNSIDSISYYTDAQHKLEWKLNSYQTKASDLCFSDLALQNARVANT